MYIEVNAVNKSYGAHQVLKDIDLTIEAPGIYALVGPNGSGKSTLLNVMVNLLSADSGTVFFKGTSNQSPNIFNDVSFLKDNTVLYPYLTGREHLRYAGSVYGISLDRIEEVIEDINILDFMDERVETYSLGMKQQLLLALSMLNNPDIILMDEPLNGLDPTRIIQVRELLISLGQAGKTILMSSHILSEVDMLTRDIYFLKEGRIFFEKLEGTNSEQRYRDLYQLNQRPEG